MVVVQLLLLLLHLQLQLLTMRRWCGAMKSAFIFQAFVQRRAIKSQIKSDKATRAAAAPGGGSGRCSSRAAGGSSNYSNIGCDCYCCCCCWCCCCCCCCCCGRVLICAVNVWRSAAADAYRSVVAAASAIPFCCCPCCPCCCPSCRCCCCYLLLPIASELAEAASDRTMAIYATYDAWYYQQHLVEQWNPRIHGEQIVPLPWSSSLECPSLPLPELDSFLSN